ncbi:MAG: shikimate dehydrogenase [Acidobacteriota bacterium]|jgi:3-dehydroquinate dehydratase/shikimate dehydrogenase|nr:shikimate dehydrogenase [Acidobacteriota bacterium]
MQEMRETGRARVCVPVCVRRASELRPSIERAAEVGDIVELRLDCLEANELDAVRSQLDALLEILGRPFIITYRPREQGGGVSLSLDERAAFWRDVPRWLRGAAKRERAFVDVELDLLESPHAESLDMLFENFQVICSHHDFQETPADLEQIYERMARTRADISKLATRANSITDSLTLMRLLERGRREGRGVIVVSMGAAGVLTRILAPAFGAFLTYGSLDAEQATAPGQIDARDLRRLYRINGLSEKTVVTGLVGSPVGHSLSPYTHNTGFASLGLDAVYLLFEVEDLPEFVRRLADPRTRELRWNLRGLSVTAPHKQAIIPHLDSVAPNAARVGAVNTVVISEERGLEGFNTDADASVVPLAGLVELRGARVAVLGAGGAARALLWALGKRGARATVFARDEARGRAVAEEFGADAAQLEGASFEGFDVVANATPLGTRGARETETAATESQLRGARVAYDLVYNPAETRFLREARAAGCETVGGLRMLVAQAEEQFRLWTGRVPPPGVMQAAAEKKLFGN